LIASHLPPPSGRLLWSFTFARNASSYSSIARLLSTLPSQYSGWTRSRRRCAPRVYNIDWGPYNREIQKKYSVFSIKFKFQISGEKPKAERFPIYHSVFPVYRSFFLVFIFFKKIKFFKN
jgi:hypothetical protein